MSTKSLRLVQASIHRSTHSLTTLYSTLKEDPIYVFLEMKLRGLVPNFHIHVSVGDLYIPTIGLPILLQIHECRNWERSHAQIHFWEHLFRYSIFAV
jgi:hypothetical protein